MFATDVREKIEAELVRARESRAQGLEGRARVCARRAAGEAAREFLRQSDRAQGSAYELLQRLAVMQQAPHRARQAAGMLAMRVDENFALLEGVDLVEEAQALFQALDGYVK